MVWLAVVAGFGRALGGARRRLCIAQTARACVVSRAAAAPRAVVVRWARCRATRRGMAVIAVVSGLGRAA